MNPNEIQITNVFVRPVGQTIDDTLNWPGPNEIVVQWTAGATANANAAVDIDISAAVWDHEAAGLVGGATLAPVAVGPDGDNESSSYETIIPIVPPLPGPPPPYRAFEVLVWLVRPSIPPNPAGTPVTIVSFYRGPLFTAW